MIIFSDKRTSRLLIYALVLGGSFYLGTFFYQAYNALSSREVSATVVRELGPQLKEAVKTSLSLNTGGRPLVIKNDELAGWLQTYRRSYSGREDLRLDLVKITEYLESIAPAFNTNPTSAKFSFKNNRAEIFIPSQAGKKINIEQSAAEISRAIWEKDSSADLVFDPIEPEITLERINSLGINTLLGRGESDYGKSPSSRINNIRVGMAKFNGIILKPGEEFSFNNLLGTVEEKDGYRAELVIKSGQLVKEFGGGLCQVSTTFFRAAILSGLEITERKPHSFPVQYYNPQGFDSTIYPGVVDLRFMNNTPAHVLIQTQLIGSRLVVEIYGSDTGYEVTLDGPFQYDQKANGALKAYFVRKFLKDGQVEKEERFDSNYRPPPASPVERNPLE